MDADQVGDLFRFVEGASLVGRLAVLNGFLTADQLEAALAARTDGKPVGEMLAGSGFLTAAQRADLEAQEAEILRADRGEPEGRALGHYVLVEQLGSGRAGIVWKAWDTKLQRWVAVKEAREEAPFARERFLREARTAAKVRHPHLVEAFEVARHEDRDFIVMTYVDGKPLDQVALPVGKAVAVMADIADAVAALHAAGVLHRDIKPQNILIDASGRGWLADFGIARDLAAQPLTVEGTLLGTPVYMAPEQAQGKPDLVREQADVYGLGSTLYHLATGRAPFLAEDDLRALLRRLSDEPPVPPRQLNAAVPEDLDFILRRALEKQPEDRYPTAAALAEDLKRFLRGEPPAARPAGPIARGARWMRREPRRMGLAAGLVALIAAVAWSVAASRRQGRYQAATQEAVERWVRGAASEALERFQAAALAAPERPEPWVMIGRCHLRLKAPAAAEASWAEALKRDPLYGPALLERGKSAMATYRPPAIRVSDGRIRFGAPDPERPDDRARRERAEEDLARARTARGLDPAELRFLEGVLAYGKREYRAAAKALGEYVRRNAWDATALSLHAAAATLSGDFGPAEQSLSRAIDLQPTADRYHARGDARFGLGRYGDAADDYARVGEDPSARCSRGLALQSERKYAEAVAEYTRALELRPGFARALCNRGTAKVELKDLDGAREDFERALEANEFYAEAYNNLGNLQLRKSAAEALRQYDLALGVDPDYVDAYVNRARARIKLEQFDEATSDLQQALKRDPGNSEAAKLLKEWSR